MSQEQGDVLVVELCLAGDDGADVVAVFVDELVEFARLPPVEASG
jgi:hypothetical protein